MNTLLEKLSILFVDDEEQTRELTARLLRWNGLVVHAAGDGETGLLLFGCHHPDIVVTDIMMPHMDGIEMSREVRRICPKTPIIIASAHINERHMVALRGIGVSSWINKPLELDRLVHEIETCCEEAGILPRLPVI
jgi:DNA-binding response OmpR family regulator